MLFATKRREATKPPPNRKYPPKQPVFCTKACLGLAERGRKARFEVGCEICSLKKQEYVLKERDKLLVVEDR